MPQLLFDLQRAHHKVRVHKGMAKVYKKQCDKALHKIKQLLAVDTSKIPPLSESELAPILKRAEAARGDARAAAQRQRG